jgi:signal transduction histidine kinase
MDTPTPHQRIRLLSFRRTVIVLAICVIASNLLFWGMLIEAVTSRAIDIITELARRQMTPNPYIAQPKCLHAPRKWSPHINKATLFAYDIQTFRSLHPKAPELPTSLLQQIKSGEKKAFSRIPLIQGGGTFLARISDRGPCSLLYVQWKMPRSDRMGLITMQVTVISVSSILCLLLGMLWIGRPLIRRIQAMAQVAQRVGQEGLTHKWSPPDTDDLSVIEQSLSQAHARILEDKQRLAAKNQALREHFANVAHDLRTPIASLQLVLERAMQQRDTHPTNELQTALADAIYLEQLTNNLSLAAQLEEGLWDKHPHTSFEVNNVIRRVASRFALLASESHISLEHAYPDSPVHYTGDEMLLERALSNLVHNALRYNQAGGHVVLLLHARGTQLTIDVMDDGPGVPSDQLDQLSRRFYRSDDARQRDQTGQGIGLAITSQVCAHLDLTLTFQHAEPSGLHATIKGTLPS